MAGRKLSAVTGPGITMGAWASRVAMSIGVTLIPPPPTYTVWPSG